MKRLIIRMLVCLIAGFGTQSARAQFAWDGDCGINWYDCCQQGKNFVNNWSIPGNPSACPALPGATDTVYLSNLVDSDGGVIHIAGLYQSGTFLCRAQQLDIQNGDIFTSGTPTEPSVFQLTGLINLYDRATFNVGSFSTLDVRSGLIRPAGGPGQVLLVSGLGTLTKTAEPASVSQIDVPIDNQGLISVPLGTLKLTGGGVSTGLIEALPDATAYIQGSLALDGEVRGDGLVYFGGGTSTVTGNYHPTNTLIQYGGGPQTVNFEADNSIENLTLGNSGSLGGTGDLSIDDLKWYEGQMLPGGTVSIQDTALFQGTMELYRDMELHGTSLMPSAWFRMQGAELRNNGDLELQGSTAIDQLGSTPNAGVKNFATMRKTGGGLSQISVILSNVGGTVEVAFGTLLLQGDMATTGPINVNAGALLILGYGQQSVFPRGGITGQGTVQFFPGHFNPVNDYLEGDYNVATTEIWGGTVQFQADGQTDTLKMYGGTLTGDAEFTISDQLGWWNAGLMNGAGITTVLGELQMNGPGYLERKLVLDDLDPFQLCDPCPNGLLNIATLGELRGNGTVEGHVTAYNGGVVSPGEAVQSPGKMLHITGNYTQYWSGELRIDLESASSYDQLHIVGNADLAGTLTVSGSAPPGQSFTILTAANVNGTFGPVNAPPGMQVIYTATSVILQSAPGTPCPADIAPGSGNGIVNVDDLLAVINSWGACANPNACPADIAPAGPPQGDDVVNVDDLLAVINAWGPCP